MSDQSPRIEQHEARDQFGKVALLTAHDLGAALGQSGDAGSEPIVVRTGGPHRTLDGLVALIDEALAEGDDPDSSDTSSYR